jgi:cytochrome P450
LNQLWNWKAGRLVNQLTRLRANANWVFFRPVAKPLREEYRARLTEYLDTAEPDGLAARITRHSAISGILAADQVTQWLFAFDAGAITAFRALALLLAHSESLANVEDLATWRSGGSDFPQLRAAFLEAVRLYPTVPALLRQTTAPTMWDGRLLKRGCCYLRSVFPS